jgi:hypothetical protein
MRRALAIVVSCMLAAAIVAAAHAHTGHGVGERPRVANLEGGPELEQVRARSVCQAPGGELSAPVATKCKAGSFPRHRIDLEDTCAGEPRTLALSSVQDFVVRLRASEIDGDAAHKEIFFDVRSGATGRGGVVRIIRMVDGAPGTCARAESLFRYPSKAAIGRLPKGASSLSSWDAEVRDYAARYRGKEVRLFETFVDRDDAYCCPTFLRKSFFRLVDGERYVRFRSETRRIKD